VPTCRLPKLKLVGVAERLPAATAVPERARLTALLEPLSVSTRVPLALPADSGAKTTLKLVLCPGIRVKGRLKPVVLKPSPVTAAWLIVRLVTPVFDNVSDWAWLVPTWTLPKLTLVGPAVSVPSSWFCALCTLDLLVLSPWQPTIVARANTITTAFQRVGAWPISD